MPPKKSAAKTTIRKIIKKALGAQDVEDKTKQSLLQEEVQAAIRLKAYELFEQRGCSHGYEAQDWLEAERIIMEQLKSRS